MKLDDTIAAISSSVGNCARMIVRVSGPEARRITQGLPLPGDVYRFDGPHSYTGQDVVEFHLPGSPVLADMVLRRLIRLGARQAEPGEFTARAYFNGKMDLTQAEGVATTISAANEGQLRAARHLMAGELAIRLRPAINQLSDVLALVEAEIDFSDEGIRFVEDSDLQQRIEAIKSMLKTLVDESARFERLNHTPTIVLAGRPNAGKSTLLNTLAGRRRAIVSPVAGTTRDALSAEIMLPRGMVRLIDVAGLDEPDGTEIATQMRLKAMAEIAAADCVVLLIDCTDPNPPIDLSRDPDLVVRTKLDSIPHWSGSLAISAQTGANIPEFRQELDRLAFGADSTGHALALNARHLSAIDRTIIALKRSTTHDSPELIAADLREALDELGTILGQITPDDLLGKIFGAFCIGK